MDQLSLNTVCREANCPNLGECYQERTATFMVMGNNCTRNCPYCNVTCSRPTPLDPDEPKHLAQAAAELELKHLVVTSVARDDLADGGAGHFAAVISESKKLCPEMTVEVLIPDFRGDKRALETVLAAEPDVLNHNIETVKELYSWARPQGEYQLSLDLLASVKEFAGQTKDKLPLVKTGIMLGLGENDQQLKHLFKDLVEHGCDLLTIGQYLQPSPQHAPLDRYVSPAEFDIYKQMALDAGFIFVASSPLVRSSYQAGEALDAALASKK